MAIEQACAWCGEWFIKKGNKKYCCKECSELADKQRTLQRNSKNRNPKRTAKGIEGLTINGVVDIMLKMTEERGKVVQYGDVQTMLYTGQIKEKDGVVTWQALQQLPA